MPDLTMNLAITLLGGLFILWFAYERGLALLMFFQQEEYDGPRFITWLKQKQGFDKTTSIWLLVAVLIGIISHTLLANTQAAFVIGGLGNYCHLRKHARPQESIRAVKMHPHLSGTRFGVQRGVNIINISFPLATG